MIPALEYIYMALYEDAPSVTDPLLCQKAIKILRDRFETTKDPIYHELLITLNSFSATQDIPVFFIEKFCLSKLSDKILERYPVNIAEAFVISYILLNRYVDVNSLYLKLGNSGLLTPTLINGVITKDVEDIAHFVVKSLIDGELITLTDNNHLIVGKKFKIDA